MLLSTVCLLAAFLFVSDIFAQNVQSAPAAKPAKPESKSTETKSEREEKSERAKRDELSKKLERRREELNALPVNNVSGSSTRTVKTQDAAPASTETKTKVKK